MQKQTFSTKISGVEVIAECNDLALQSHGSVLLRAEDTVVLATVVMSKNAREGTDFFPLTVEYEEKFYAAGQILGSRFMRREGKPSDEAVLTARMIDRTIRPLFPQHLRNEVQVVITVLSLGDYDPDTLAINAASLALGTSPIPWGGPVSAVRLSKKDDVVTVFPTYESRQTATLNGLVCGRNGLINMVEVNGAESPEEDVVEMLEEATKHIEAFQEFQTRILTETGKKKLSVSPPQLSDELTALFDESIAPQLEDALFTPGTKSILGELQSSWYHLVNDTHPKERTVAMQHLESAIDTLVHTKALLEDERVDGRAFDEIRPLFAEAGGISKRIHGSGIFYRGATHIFSALTLGGPDDFLIVDGMEEQSNKRFLHHYNFPPFSTGETGRVGGFNRRMIGHGALAERALHPVIPTQDVFPYTIRIVSEVLSSNGSSSMGSVCGSTLALMDAGVPITAPVAGIAMGLMQNKETYRILTDIQGPEDHYGDMDLKVAGTRTGITAIQMDVKVEGITIPILTEALAGAKKAREEILAVIEKAIEAPRENISIYAPEVVRVQIQPKQIGSVIGPGGKIINGIKDETGAEISVEDDGTVYITGKNGAAQKAATTVENITHIYAVGEEYDGTVTNVTDFGAFVKIGYNKEGLVHISEIAPFHIKTVSEGLKEGDVVPVVVKEIDERHRINLSIKDRDPDFAEKHGFTPDENTDGEKTTKAK